MRLTTRTGYGLHALFDMAFHGSGRSVQAKEIADRQAIPLRYLEQILQDLRRAGLVDAKRGPRGGYSLGLPAASVRLSDVITAVDGPVEALLALGTEAPAPPGTSGSESGARDVPALVWGELVARVAESFTRITLQDFVARAEAMGVSRAVPAPQMYFI